MPTMFSLIARFAPRLLPLLALGIPATALAQDNSQICGDWRTYGRAAQVTACTAIIRSGAATAETYQMRAEGRWGINDVPGALADVEQALRLNPNYGRAYGVRGAIYRFSGQPQRALPDLTRALQLDPSLAANWGLRGDIYAELGDFARAAADFAEANRLTGQFGEQLAEASRLAQEQRSGPEPGPLGLQNMPAPANAGANAPAAMPAASAAANGDVFEDCIRREGPEQSGIQVLYYLRNACRTRISLSYCLEATFEAAGDYNLCSRREYKTHSVAPGDAVHFAFNLMPPGTALSDGRQVTSNTLYVRGHACANDSSPDVYFDGGSFRFMHC